MDLKSQIYCYLTKELKCIVEERNDIWYITAPDGTHWDMTIPMRF